MLESRPEQSGEGRNMRGRAVGQPAVALAPDVCGGGECRRVGRKRLEVPPRMPPDALLDFTTAMERPPLPEEAHRSVQMAQQRLEEATDIQAIAASGLEADVQGQAAPVRRERPCAAGREVATACTKPEPPASAPAGPRSAYDAE